MLDTVAALPEQELEVAALPEQELEVAALPFSAAVIVPALKLPEASRRTIRFPVFALDALIVALFAWLVIVAALPVQEPDEPVTFPVTLPVTAPVKGPTNDVASTLRFNTNLFELSTYRNVGLLAYVPIVKPAPFAAALEAAFFAILIFKSAISKVVELTVVVVPETVRLPETVKFPATVPPLLI